MQSYEFSLYYKKKRSGMKGFPFTDIFSLLGEGVCVDPFSGAAGTAFFSCIKRNKDVSHETSLSYSNDLIVFKLRCMAF